MKFRNKVLMINILLLSTALGIVGFLMVDKNFKLALEAQLQNAIMENNLLQSSIEHEILDIANSNNGSILTPGLINAGEQVSSSILSTDTSLYIYYQNKSVYASNESETGVPDSLLETSGVGSKNYCIVNETDGWYVYVISASTLQEHILNIISRTNISAPYNLMNTQITYYRILLLVVVGIYSALIYLFSSLLTKPLEQLNKVSDHFADGDYSVRSDIHSNDEIELLSNKFNHMADSVSSHIEELNDMVTRREQFVSDFTHEIKTPMTTIIGYADTIRSKELSKERRVMAANYIFSEGKRLENMSFKLFDLIYLGKHDIAGTRISTENLLQNIAEITAPMLEAKKIKLTLTCENATIIGDKDLLVSAIVNLIDNAKKASKEGDEIILRGYRDENNYHIEVQDFGRGMTQEQVKHVCDEFYMADKSRSRKEGGAGLGLSLAAIIFERHHAEITIESEPQKGTLIEVVFKMVFKETDI